MRFLYLLPFLLFVLPAFENGSLAQNQPLTPGHPLSGSWRVNLTTSDVGTVRTIMALKVTGEGFEGHSRSNADKALIGAAKAGAARIFTSSFKNGALLHLEKGKLRKLSEREYKVAAILNSASGRYLFQGTVKGDSLKGLLTNGKGQNRGSLTAMKGSFTYPLDDYRTVAEKALKVTEAKIFDREQVKTESWKTFEKAIMEVAGKAQDDLDLVFGFFYYARRLPFSHYALYRKENAATAADSAVVPAKENNLTLETITPTAAYLKIASFAGSGATIDSVFNIIKKQNLPNLVIDLRGNSGGNISGLKVVTNLADKSYPGGAFVTNKWFEKHATPPTVTDLQKFQVLSEANLSLLWDGIHNLEGLAIKVVPEATVYKGKVYVLTDKATASTCEPLVYGLKHYKLAEIVGEKTAGAMLNGESFPIMDSWQVTIPTADYYTPDGKRLDQAGVEPDVKVAGKEALNQVLKMMR